MNERKRPGKTGRFRLCGTLLIKRGLKAQKAAEKQHLHIVMIDAQPLVGYYRQNFLNGFSQCIFTDCF